MAAPTAPPDFTKYTPEELEEVRVALFAELDERERRVIEEHQPVPLTHRDVFPEESKEEPSQ